MKEDVTLLGLAGFFALMSSMAIGGASTSLPDIYRHFVDVNGWISGREFVALVAIAQAAPGPNAIFTTLFGWRVAGLPGGLVSTAAFCGPSSIAMLYVNRLLQRYEGTRWRTIIQRGLGPVAIGIVLSSGYILTRTAAHDWASLGVAVAAASVAIATKTNYLWILLAAAVLGVAGFV